MHSFNEGISAARFPDILKNAEVKLVFKKNLELIKKTTDLSAFYLQSRKFLKDRSLSN